MPSQPRQGLMRIRSALVEANTYNVSSFVESFQKHIYNNLPSHKLSSKLTGALEEHLLRRLLFDTSTFLRLRISQVPWLFASSSPLLDALHNTPLKAIPCHTRLAILRWIIDSEPDLHFRLRPHLSRSAPCICGCGRSSSIYPAVFLQGLSTPPTSTLTFFIHFPFLPFLMTLFRSNLCTSILPSLLPCSLPNGHGEPMRLLTPLHSFRSLVDFSNRRSSCTS